MQGEDSGDVIANEAVANVEENPAEAYSKPILTEDKLTKWGLGRGVDITKPTPWLDKTSFQVRAVCKKDLIETDEGGLLKGYSEEVNSSTTIHYQVRAGVKAPDVPLSIGVDSEYSRTDCSNKHVVGLKVKNRTISFRVDFDDLPKSRVASVKESKKQMQSDNTEVTYTSVPKAAYQPTATSESKPEDTPFEIRLCGWLCECLELRGIRARGVKPQELMFLKIEKEGEDKGKRLIDSEEETRQLQEDITHFIRQLGVTHYVSAIELGGLNFRVLTEKEYERKIALSGSASLNSKLYGAIEATSSKTNIWKLKSKREERKMIGKITRNKEREIVYPKDEAVIGCQIRPISNLLRNPYLQQAVNESVRRYTQETISSKLAFY